MAFKVAAGAFMLATPLLGVWVASSLAAYANARVGWVVASGLLLFPGLPLAWEGFAAWRRRARQSPRPHVLTFGDRLLLRTLVLAVGFLAVLLASRPKVAFVALSARGDWFLRGRHGAVADRVRRGAFRLAGGLEWLYEATHKNPYEKFQAKKEPKPTPAPTSSAPTPAPTGSSPTVLTTSHEPRWPMPVTLEPVVEHIPASEETSIESVARYIGAREHDPVLRVKALHDWVADRIAYDGPAFRAGNVPLDDAEAEPVFTRRLAVCAGYAQLLAALGKVTGDDIEYVVGNVRTTETPVDGAPHAWNAVRLEGAWYLLNPTFDAGYLDGSTFHKKYSTDYLFAPPEVFGVTHFPEDPAWQLRKTPLSRGDFIRQPMLQPAFYARGLHLLEPDRSQVSVTGPFELRLQNRGTYLLVSYLAAGATGQGTNCEVQGFDRATCDLPTGAWRVQLFGNDAPEGSFEFLGSLDVNRR